MNYNIKIENNSDKYKADWKDKKKRITYSMGLLWQSIATSIMTSKSIVDTGRLRASLTFITKTQVGRPLGTVAESRGNDFLKGSSGNENDLIVGSNVEYATKIELNGRKGSFVRPAILEYKEDYRNLTRNIMEEE